MSKLSTAFLSICVFSCVSVTQLQDRGKVRPSDFRYSMDFITYNSVILFPVEINGEIKNFFFDTGAQLNLIQSDQLSGRKTTVVGASQREQEFSRKKIKSMRIGEVEFVNVVSLKGDLSGLKEAIPDFGGAIGQSIISKSNWKIDYPNKQLQISNGPLADGTFEIIDITRKGGSPRTTLTVNGIDYDVLIDLGASSRGIGIPENHPLADKVREKYELDDNFRKVYSIGGLQDVTEKVGVLPEALLSGVVFTDIPIEIRKSSQLRVGMNFFRDCVLVIDNINSDYKVKKRSSL